ncbi:MAG: cystathionine beta-synthase [Myxococcales bacterium]|nr:cystathionine beta-synthase [Myxococcales bacterium]
MKGAYQNILQAIGRTPIVRLNKVATHVLAQVFAKLEFMNPAGSVKDRPALQIVEDAEEQGLLKSGGTIVEATSGNTGMGLAMAAAIKGYKTIFVMPDKMSDEKIKALRAFGSRVVITPTDVEPEDPRSYYNVARRLVQETPGAFLANQYHNPSNPKAHVLSTGPEIWEQTGGEVDAVVIAMGTGGTISGIGRYLKEQKPSIRVIGIDPIGSIFYDYFRTGRMTTAHSYKVEGFGEDFIPGTMDFSVVDDVVRVSDKECFQWTRRVVREEGIYCGGSSGGAICGAVKWAERNPKPLNILVILPDGATRYLSKVFDDTWMKENGYLDNDLTSDRVSDVLKEKSKGVVTVDAGQTLREVIDLLRTHGFSQVPVVENRRVVGIVSETDILRALTRGQATLDAAVGGYVSGDYTLVESHNSTGVLTQLLAQNKVAIVADGGMPIGIVTKIDFIEYVASRVS